MGTGIGKYCKICEEQLRHDIGYNSAEDMCSNCEALLPKFAQYLLEKIKP